MSYVGIPFKDVGYDEKGCHCWGLVRLVLKREWNIDVPEYGEIGAKDLLKIVREMRRQRETEVWRNVTAEPRRAGDCILMRRHEDVDDSPFHIGIMLDERRLLHVERKANSHTALLSDPMVAGRILGAYRHKDMP